MAIKYLDWFLILPFISALVMVAEIDAPRAVLIEIGPWAKGAVLAAMALAASVIVAAASAIDRRCTEEYAFQIMANAALVALAATMLVHLGWIIAKKALGLPELDSDNIIGIMVIGWVTSYYWFRLRGITQ
ncbi:hypothetical protein [Qipengyuania sp. ASV99]|uniref:hypothetical protein n=1 Tax=Qipengyuania sp. ASV99 TaxID=3399681 RepID=UPI003A4C78BC